MNQENKLFNLFTSEKGRGLVNSAVGSIILNGVNAAAISFLGVDPITSSVVILTIFGSIVAYALDILTAKQKFDGIDVSYLALGKRAQWLLRSFAGPQFQKFLIATTVTGILGAQMMAYSFDWLDRHKIDFMFRDAIAAAGVSLIIFLVFSNILLFNWAYIDDIATPLLDVVMLAWLGVMLMIYFTLRNERRQPKQESRVWR